MKKINVQEQSEKYRLNKTDGVKILKGAGIAFGGFVLTYLLDLLPQIDFGDKTALIVPIMAVILNSLLKTVKSK